MLSPIINVNELLAIYKSNEVIIVDCSNNTQARANYEKEHLDKAIFVDLNTDLADIKDNPAEGGRHPLPSLEIFATTLGKFGMNPNSHIVIYDHKNGANAAARFWWMLKAIGHDKVQVLNGGFEEAVKQAFPINNKKEIPRSGSEYPARDWQWPLADINEVREASKNSEDLIIDVREETRHKGIHEPIDSIAGHIPNAINVPFTSNLDEQGQFLSPKVLREKYEKLFQNHKIEKIIVHCGSGVTACHTILAIYYAGLAIPKLYVGSWSEWSRN